MRSEAGLSRAIDAMQELAYSDKFGQGKWQSHWTPVHSRGTFFGSNTDVKRIHDKGTKAK